MKHINTDHILLVGVSHISRDAAAKLVNKTVPIPGMPGQYVVELSVFHQLHCLVSIAKPIRCQKQSKTTHML